MAAAAIPTNDRENLVIAVMGAMGMGKSSTLNSIIQEPLFKTGRSLGPVTRTIMDSTKPWQLPPVGRNVHIVDTPGMCDSSYGDRSNAEEIVRFFKTLSYGVSAFVIVFNVHDTRLDDYSKNMLMIFQELLTPEFWKYVVVVFTHVDEEQRDILDVNIDVLEHPETGFVPELRASHGFRIPQDAEIPLVFLSNRSTRFSPYAYDCFQKLYESVISRERVNGGHKFSCQFFQRILGISEGDRARFILKSFQFAANIAIPMVQHAMQCSVQ